MSLIGVGSFETRRLKAACSKKPWRAFLREAWDAVRQLRRIGIEPRGTECRQTTRRVRGGRSRRRGPLGLPARFAKEAWGVPLNLGSIINTEANERSPALSRDGHLLLFASTRADGLSGFDIWVAWRAHSAGSCPSISGRQSTRHPTTSVRAIWRTTTSGFQCSISSVTDRRHYASHPA
jgi:hypothetical protein